MKIASFFALVVLLSVSFVVKGSAQEIQVPIDEEGKLEYIDAKLEQKLGLFTDYINFREARLFQISDTTFVLEIYYQPQKRLLKVRLPHSAEEVKDLRRKVTERLKQQVPQVVLNQEGRNKLLIGALSLSLGYYGWAVPAVLNVQDAKSTVALYMLTSSAGFFIPLYATRNIAVTNAAAILSLYGSNRGIVHGIFLNRLLFGKESTERGILAFGMLGSITEAISGFFIADKSNIDAGTAVTICVGGDFGLGWGVGTAHLAGFLEDDNGRSVAGSILLGSGVGLLAGKLLANKQPYTRGDAYVLQAMGILGAYIPLAIVDIAGAENAKVYTAAAMLGSAIGLGLGHKLTGGKNFSTSQGNLISLSGLSGGLLGLGLAYLISSEGDNSALYLTSSSLGALGGFWLMYRSFAQSAKKAEKSFSWNINVLPEGLVALAMGKRINPAWRVPVPLLKLNFRF
jgi:hypothetical protein